MKKTFVQLLSPVVIAAVLISCGSATSKDDMQKDLKEEAQKEVSTNTPKETPKDSPSTDGPKEVMTVAGATAFLKEGDANKGKLITISAYPKGMTKAVNGEFQLFVSDKTGSGLTNENFACAFKEDMKEAVKTHKADKLVTVTGNIGWKNGMILLSNAKLAE